MHQAAGLQRDYQVGGEREPGGGPVAADQLHAGGQVVGLRRRGVEGERPSQVLTQ